jgi:hypothetical protein
MILPCYKFSNIYKTTIQKWQSYGVVSCWDEYIVGVLPEGAIDKVTKTVVTPLKINSSRGKPRVPT